MLPGLLSFREDLKAATRFPRAPSQQLVNTTQPLEALALVGGLLSASKKYVVFQANGRVSSSEKKRRPSNGSKYALVQPDALCL